MDPQVPGTDPQQPATGMPDTGAPAADPAAAPAPEAPAAPEAPVAPEAPAAPAGGEQPPTV